MVPPDKPSRAATGRRPARFFVSSGEVSGDIGGAHLVRQMRRDYPDARFFGIGGARMREAGVDVDVLTNHLGTVGVTEAISRFAPLARLGWRTRRRILAERPDAAILIANDLFNAALARWLKRRGIPTAAYFPPQVWIWGAVLNHVARGFDLVITPFPEEQEAYARARPGLRSECVGHYLTDELAPPTPDERRSARKRLQLPETGRVVALLTGSRMHEVRALAPVLMGAARMLLAHDPGLRFVTPIAEPGLTPPIERAAARDGLRNAIVFAADSHDVLRASDLALVTSGTSTLEAALLEIPMVVVYRMSAVTHAVVRTCFRIGLLEPRPISLPNLLLGRDVVPECLQGEATPDLVAREAWSILSGPERQARMRADLAAVRDCVVGPQPLRRAGEAIYGLAADSVAAASASWAAKNGVPWPPVCGTGADGARET